MTRRGFLILNAIAAGSCSTETKPGVAYLIPENFTGWCVAFLDPSLPKTNEFRVGHAGWVKANWDFSDPAWKKVSFYYVSGTGKLTPLTAAGKRDHFSGQGSITFGTKVIRFYAFFVGSDAEARSLKKKKMAAVREYADYAGIQIDR